MSLRFKIETYPEIPDRIGKGTLLFLSGWCFHEEDVVEGFRVSIGSLVQDFSHLRLPRFDVATQEGKSFPDLGYRAVTSGFIIRFPLKSKVEQPLLRIEALIRKSLKLGVSGRGAVYDTEFMAEVLLNSSVDIPNQANISNSTPLPNRGGSPNQATLPNQANRPKQAAKTPQTTICLTTYNPDVLAFRQQVESLRAQTYRDWHCIVQDDYSSPAMFKQIQAELEGDSRFSVFRNSATLGFYKNFEVCLKQVPEESQWVALCDQDDIWYPDKLEKCVKTFRAEIVLVYSDMRIVDSSGNVISKSYWTQRKNNYQSLKLLLGLNTITGASAVFRRTLLDDILPFPVHPYVVFHDHWIACVAVCRGKISYLPEPLYDYVQHGRNVIGYSGPTANLRLKGLSKFLSNLISNLRSKKTWQKKLLQYLVWRQNRYLEANQRIICFVETLSLRAVAEKGNLGVLKMYGETFLNYVRLLFMALLPSAGASGGAKHAHIDRPGELAVVANYFFKVLILRGGVLVKLVLRMLTGK